MKDEKNTAGEVQNGQTAAEELTEQDQLERSAPRPAQGQSIFRYLAVLFGVAFMLLLFAYLMQQRDSAEITGYLSDLRESMGSIQSIDQLVEENQSLREEIAALRTEQQAAEQSLQDRSDEIVRLQEELAQCQELLNSADQQNQAMDAFWQLNESFVQGHYKRCRELIQWMESGGLAMVLPDTNYTDYDHPSPAERYQEIVVAMEEMEED